MVCHELLGTPCTIAARPGMRACPPKAEPHTLLVHEHKMSPFGELLRNKLSLWVYALHAYNDIPIKATMQHHCILIVFILIGYIYIDDVLGYIVIIEHCKGHTIT